ncbi:MAG: hypothetical protein HY016_09920 [Nitrosomonadales bacterium]|nr:hypothetical protein [Nitrosomonadales bacterium]
MTIKKNAAAPLKAATKKISAAAKPAAKVPAKSGLKSAAAQAAKKPRKESKIKVVRDSFTMPQNEYAKIAEIKAICLKAKIHVKKSEVLRAGLKALSELNATQLKRALSDLEKIKTGRPLKH